MNKYPFTLKPPFVHSGRTVFAASLHMLMALLPAVGMAIYHYGIEAARVLALAVAVAVVTEIFSWCILPKTRRAYDCSAIIIGILFAFLLPATAPWWLVVLGSATSVLLGRQVFGGLGANIFCPALVGWLLVFLIWPVLMNANLSILTTDFQDPLAYLRAFGGLQTDMFTSAQLLRGEQLGALGASQVGALLVGGIYLVLVGVLRWEIPAAVLTGVFLAATGLVIFDPTTNPLPEFHLFTGSVVLVAFFLASDPASSPVDIPSMLLYGAFIGIVTVLLRSFELCFDGAPFAVLAGNALTPLFNMMRRRPFGVRSRT